MWDSKRVRVQKEIKMKLLIFDKDWADEFDVYGFTLMSDEEYIYFDKAMNSISQEPCGWYFGTNEGYEDESIADMLSDVEVKDITLEEYNTIKKLFMQPHRKSWGNTPVEYILENFESEEIDE